MILVDCTGNRRLHCCFAGAAYYSPLQENVSRLTVQNSADLERRSANAGSNSAGRLGRAKPAKLSLADCRAAMLGGARQNC